jgi:glutamyl/glutaminyl-tRNA synthetase
VDENLALFRAMRDRHYAEGELNLRLKMDLYHDDGAMWDTCEYQVRVGGRVQHC